MSCSKKSSFLGSGAFVIDKPTSVSSFDVIRKLQSALLSSLGCKKGDLPKLGHGGTLDPFASGLLILGVDQGVKLCQTFLGSDKTYQGSLWIGRSSPSLDPETPISTQIPLNKPFIKTQDPSFLESIGDQFLEALKRIETNIYLQTPPMYSAKKQSGKRLYELARQGIEVQRTPKLCKIWDSAFISKPTFKEDQFGIYIEILFNMSCSSGTYVRTWAEDLGKIAGYKTMLGSLRRTQSGGFSINDSISLSELLENVQNRSLQLKGVWTKGFIELNQLMFNHPRINLNETHCQRLQTGHPRALELIFLDFPSADPRTNEYLAFYFQEKLIGFAKSLNEKWELARVFYPSA